MALPDAELVQRTLDGDREAFGDLVDRHRRVVFAMAVQKGLQAVEAEDVAQEVFIKAFGGLATLKDPKAFEAWLYGIASHVIADGARMRRRMARREEVGLDQRPEPYAEDRCDRDRDEEKDQVLRAIGELPEDQRLVVTLRYLHGLTPKEIAERLREPRGTVRSRLHHALTFLQEAFGEGSARRRRGDACSQKTRGA